VTPVVRYLQAKLGVVFAVPEFRVDKARGIVDIDTSVNWLIQDLRARRIGGVYLPNTRWFEAWITQRTSEKKNIPTSQNSALRSLLFFFFDPRLLFARHLRLIEVYKGLRYHI
jgi:hypothetical protein